MENYLDTINGVSKITNLGVKNTQGLFEIIRSVMVHEVACEALDHTEGRLKTTKIFLPSIGILEVSFTKGEPTSFNFTPESRFKDSLEKAVKTGESELLKKVESSMIEKIKERYDALV